MRVLCVANAWPDVSGRVDGIFVKRQVTALQRLGVEVETTVIGAGSGPAWVRGVAELRSRLASGGFDLVHAQYGGRTALAAVSASRLPVVISFCGTDLNGLACGPGLDRAYAAAGVLCSQLAAPLAVELIAKSEALAERLWRQVDRRRCHVIPNGVDMELFREIDRAEARARVGWAPDQPVVLVSGQTGGPVKRLDLAREIVAAAAREVPGLRMHVLTGVSPDEVPYYLNAADLVLLTSQHEGSPNVVKEALACNVSVVSVEVGDVRRWLGETLGCRIVPRNPARLAEAVVAAVRAGGRSAGRMVVQEIAQERVARRVAGVYERAIKTARRG